jgi:AcrR family transcriptional regulator
MSFREKKKARTRLSIAGAALELFAKNGFDQTTVDAIAAQAEISRRTFFRYFESKEEAFFSHGAERLDHFKQLLQLDPGETPFTAVRRACLAMGRVYMMSQDEMLIKYKVILDSKLLLAFETRLDAAWEEVISEALTRDIKPSKAQMLDASLQAGAVLGMIRAALRLWFDSECQLDLEALGRKAFSRLESGFPTLTQHAGEKR